MKTPVGCAGTKCRKNEQLHKYDVTLCSCSVCAVCSTAQLGPEAVDTMPQTLTAMRLLKHSGGLPLSK